MKVLYCQDCGDIISPFKDAYKPRFCQCMRHAVWWRNPFTGQLSVCDTFRIMETYTDEEGKSWPVVKSGWTPAAYVIGMTNNWLGHTKPYLQPKDYEDIIAEIPDDYIFKTHKTVAIRILPGHSRDTQYDELPTV